jgi:hypothetical protein
MEKMFHISSIDSLKLDKRFFSHFISFLAIPGLIFLSFIVIGLLLNAKLPLIYEPFLLGANFSILFCIAFFIVPLKAYQFTFLPPASWERSIFFENWIYIDIIYLLVLAVVLALFTNRTKLIYSCGIYILILVGSRIIMHLALHIFGYEAYYDF